MAAGTCEGIGAIGKLGSWDPDGKSWVLTMERRTLMTTTASRGNLRVTVRAASPLGAAASALLAMSVRAVSSAWLRSEREGSK